MGSWLYKRNFLLREKKWFVCKCWGKVDVPPRCQISGVILERKRDGFWDGFVFYFLIAFSMWEWGCPQCKPSSATALSVVGAWAAAERRSWAPARGFFLFFCSSLSLQEHWQPPCCVPITCKPHSVPTNTPRVWISEGGGSWPLINSFLPWKHLFFTEINLYGQRFSQMSLDYFQQSELTTTAINCIWAGATSDHHFPAVAKVWRRWRAGQGVSGCRTVAAGQDISYLHQKFPWQKQRG